MELRWNPLLEEWVAVASHRQERPQLPEDWCPFCPGSGSVPIEYDVHLYPNDFPTFATPAPNPGVSPTSLYKVDRSAGVCDVVLYHPDHTKQLGQLNVAHIVKLVRLWQSRFAELAKRTEIKYVFIFENKGAAIGVTIHHPHGQIYAFPYIPPKIASELGAARAYFDTNKQCLLCAIVDEEIRDGRRIVLKNSSFVGFVPFFARWPYEIHLVATRHVQTITEFSDVETESFARSIKMIAQKYDNLFGFSFPYIMAMHQSPTDGTAYPHYHFHVEFYPPHRSATKLKYSAGCESGAGTFINDTVPEETGGQLRATPPGSADALE